ncbi:hypothetical protein [Streptomyces parvus]|uniref:Uncharacterized protein n=1 Tax=Streptomyces parvus TaxID=66428 RepID=A0A7K3RT96_9ACTN|nr:hypothetical protein [Streptomyces parvus]NEC18456.1 hypothetical protein [Streptomyces parvus]
MGEELIDPILPPGKTIEQQRADPPKPPKSSCRVLVDKQFYLFMSVSQIDEFADPMSKEEGRPFRNRQAIKDLPFEGKGAVGETNAMVSAKCDSDKSRYVIVEFSMGERLDEDAAMRRDKMERFAKGYTEAVMEQVSCSA